jgi:hypothetical protein
MSDRYSEALARLKEHLALYPQVVLIEKEDAVSVEQADESGYTVEMANDGHLVTINAGPYHDHFDDPEEAAASFMWMLTPLYQVVAHYRNGKIQGALLQTADGHRLGSVKAKFIHKATETVVLRNRHIPAPGNDEPK